MEDNCDEIDIQSLAIHSKRDAKLLDKAYLEKWTEILGLQGTRVVWALHVAGHSNLSGFSLDEWSAFCVGFGGVISEMRARETIRLQDITHVVYH